MSRRWSLFSFLMLLYKFIIYILDVKRIFRTKLLEFLIRGIYIILNRLLLKNLMCCVLEMMADPLMRGSWICSMYVNILVLVKVKKIHGWLHFYWTSSRVKTTTCLLNLRFIRVLFFFSTLKYYTCFPAITCNTNSINFHWNTSNRVSHLLHFLTGGQR